MAGKRKIRWDRLALLLAPFVIIIALICTKCGGSPGNPEENSRPKATIEGSLPAQTGQNGTDNVQQSERSCTVVIDAGHGGNDGGCTDLDGKRLEKDDNLRLSLLVRDYLLKYPGVNVIMTRTEDVFVGLEERCRIANEAKADLFVSLHRNAASNASGVEIWINSASNNKNSAVEHSLAGHIRELLTDVGVSYDRGIRSGFRNSENGSKEDNYYVNRNTDMPSCLIEMGFMTSDIDNTNFDRRLDAYADAIASAIIETAEDTNLNAPEETTAEAAS